MRHGRVHARLCADSEVVDHAVLRGELLGVYRRKEILDVHEALVYGDLTVAGVHVTCAVFLGVDDVHQPPQALRGVLAEADVDVDAAGTVGLCARRPDGSDDLLHHLDVLVAAHRADHLRRGGGDRAVALDRPVPPAASRKRGAAPALPLRVRRVPA